MHTNKAENGFSASHGHSHPQESRALSHVMVILEANAIAQTSLMYSLRAVSRMPHGLEYSFGQLGPLPWLCLPPGSLPV